MPHGADRHSGGCAFTCDGAVLDGGESIDFRGLSSHVPLILSRGSSYLSHLPPFRHLPRLGLTVTVLPKNTCTDFAQTAHNFGVDTPYGIRAGRRGPHMPSDEKAVLLFNMYVCTFLLTTYFTVAGPPKLIRDVTGKAFPVFMPFVKNYSI
jgi:hypothetical protein